MRDFEPKRSTFTQWGNHLVVPQNSRNVVVFAQRCDCRSCRAVYACRLLLCNAEYLTSHGDYGYLWIVPKQNHQIVQRPNPVHIDTHAAASLRYIRASMESATSFAVPGSAGIAMGSVGLLTAALSSAPSMHPYWLLIWLTAALVAAALGGSLLVRPSSLRGLTLAGSPIHRFALCLLPSLFAGAILTAVHWYYGNMPAIPGTWLLLYGCALVASSVSTTRTIGVMGGLFIGLSLLAFVLPENLQILVLGIGFGGLHILFGILIGRMGHGRQI